MNKVDNSFPDGSSSRSTPGNPVELVLDPPGKDESWIKWVWNYEQAVRVLTLLGNFFLGGSSPSSTTPFTVELVLDPPGKDESWVKWVWKMVIGLVVSRNGARQTLGCFVAGKPPCGAHFPTRPEATRVIVSPR